MPRDLFAELTLNPGATPEAIDAFIKKVCKALKVDASRIPADYLAFLRRSDGASGDFAEGGSVILSPIKQTLTMGRDYHFTSRGWMYIGGNGFGSGFGIDLTSDPPSYIGADYVGMHARFMGTTFDQFLDAAASGQLPRHPGDRTAPTSAAGQAGLIGEFSRRGTHCVAWTREGHCLLTSNSKPLLSELDPRTRKVVREFAISDPASAQGRINHAAVSPDGRLLAVALQVQALFTEGAVVIFDTASAKQLWRADLGKCGYPRTGPPGCVSFTPDGKSVVFQSPGDPVRFFDASTGRPGITFAIPTEQSEHAVSRDHALAISHDGQRIAVSPPAKSTILLFNLAGELQAEFPYGAQAIGWNSDSSVLLLASGAPQIQILDAKDGKLLHWFALNSPTYTAPFLTADGRIVALDCDGIRTWDMRSGQFLGLLPHSADCLFVDRDGRTAATWEHSTGTGRLWRLPGGGVPALPTIPPQIDPASTQTHPIALLPGMRGCVNALASAANTLVAATDAGFFYIWDTKTWALRREVEEIAGLDRRSLALSADGSVAMSISRGRTFLNVDHWETTDGQWQATAYATADGRKLAQMPAQDCLPSRGDIAPDGRCGFIAFDDLSIRRWDLAANTLSLFAKVPSAARCVSVTPDGKLLAIGLDSGILFLDAATGAAAGELPTKEGPVEVMSFSPDMRFVLTYHPVKVQNSPVSTLHDLARRKQIRAYKPTASWLGPVVWLPGNEEFLIAMPQDDRAVRYGVSATKKLETLALDCKSYAGLAGRCLTRVGDNFLVSAGDANTSSLRIWQLVPNSQQTARVPDE
jgi:WD40 repeat protein